MARPLPERVLDPLWWGEQGLHLFLAAVPCLLVYRFRRKPVVGFTLAAVWIASVREFVDQLPVESIGDSVADWTAIVVGCVGAAYVVVLGRCDENLR